MLKNTFCPLPWGYKHVYDHYFQTSFSQDTALTVKLLTFRILTTAPISIKKSCSVFVFVAYVFLYVLMCHLI